MYQLDTGRVNHSKPPGEIRKYLLDDSVQHLLTTKKDRAHTCKVLDFLYEFRSDRGVVHISQIHDANQMDSMLVLHSCKWVLAEILRMARGKNESTIGELIASLVQLDHAVIYEIDGKPLVLATHLAAGEEALLLLNHSPLERLPRKELRSQLSHHKPNAIGMALKRLDILRQVWLDGDCIALTPTGQERIRLEIMPKVIRS